MLSSSISLSFISQPGLASGVLRLHRGMGWDWDGLQHVLYSKGHSTSACSAGIDWLKASLGMSILPQPMLGEVALVAKSSRRT